MGALVCPDCGHYLRIACYVDGKPRDFYWCDNCRRYTMQAIYRADQTALLPSSILLAVYD